MVLIISDKLDLQIYRVVIELEQMGVEHGLLNVADYPTAASVTQRFASADQSCSLALHEGPQVDGRDVQAVWYRKPGLPRLHPDVTEAERQFAFSESQAGLRGLYDALSHAYWMSRLENIRTASNKLAQLRLAARLGFEIPRSLFTNDAAEARSFLTSQPTRVVYKPIGDPGLIERDGPWDSGHVVGELYTTLLDAATIEAGLRRLSACPVLLQEYVEKDVELRITVVGTSVFAVEIHSQAQADTTVDWKQGSPLLIEHRVHELPARVETLCVELVRAYGLEFGAIDMVKTPDGRYVFLELNPNGQYGWLEDLTPLRISKAIAELLAQACVAA